MGRIGDFSHGTIKFLAEATDHCCARCYKKTSYFCTINRKRIGYGRGSHIVAASSGGPRADEEYTEEQLKAATNGVHLCANCADLVDKSPAEYPVYDLKELQRVAEERARNAVTGIGNASLMSFDQSQRVSSFLREVRTVLSYITLNQWGANWDGRWKANDLEKARSLYRECHNINYLYNKYNGGVTNIIQLQGLVVANIHNMVSRVEKAPWYYSNDGFGAEYILSANNLFGEQRQNVNAEGKYFNQLLNDTYGLVNHLQSFTASGESPVKPFQFLR